MRIEENDRRNRNFMQEYQIAELYRQIGKTLREKGADRVILLRSHKHLQDEGMTLEIAVDGSVHKEQLDQLAAKLWPKLHCSFLDLNEEGNEELLLEAIEDGILL